MTRRRREGTDYRHRRGDHQGARTGDHQQHQTTIQPGLEGKPHEHRRHEHNEQRHKHYGRGVITGKLVHKALGGRPLCLCFLHRLDDFSQRGMRVVRADLHLNDAMLVDRAGEHSIPDRLFHRQAFARNGCLVHRAAAGHHLTIQWHALARQHLHDLARQHSTGLHHLPRPAGRLQAGRFRGHGHQLLDGPASLFQRVGLDQLSDGKEHCHHRGFRPLTDQHGARDGDRHQKVDIQREGLEGDPAFAQGIHATQGNRQQGECNDRPRRLCHAGKHQSLGQESQYPRNPDTPPSHPGTFLWALAHIHEPPFDGGGHRLHTDFLQR